MSALAGTISAPFTAGTGSIGTIRWLRSALSLALAAGVLAVALPAAFGSGASAGVDPIQVFSSGPLIAARASGGAQLSIDGIVPGQSRIATVQVSNAGSGPTTFSLASHVTDRPGPGGGVLSQAMTLRIAATGNGSVLYQGPLGGMSHIALGRIPAGGERTYRVTVALPDSAGNEVEGSSSSAGFIWNAA